MRKVVVTWPIRTRLNSKEQRKAGRRGCPMLMDDIFPASFVLLLWLSILVILSEGGATKPTKRAKDYLTAIVTSSSISDSGYPHPPIRPSAPPCSHPHTHKKAKNMFYILTIWRFSILKIISSNDKIVLLQPTEPMRSLQVAQNQSKWENNQAELNEWTKWRPVAASRAPMNNWGQQIGHGLMTSNMSDLPQADEKSGGCKQMISCAISLRLSLPPSITLNKVTFTHSSSSSSAFCMKLFLFLGKCGCYRQVAFQQPHFQIQTPLLLVATSGIQFRQSELSQSFQIG